MHTVSFVPQATGIRLAKQRISNTRNGAHSKAGHQGTARHYSEHDSCFLSDVVGLREMNIVCSAQVQCGYCVCDARRGQPRGARKSVRLRRQIRQVASHATLHVYCLLNSDDWAGARPRSDRARHTARFTIRVTCGRLNSKTTLHGPNMV